MAERKTVLILEDEEDMRDAIARGFAEESAYDFRVEIAATPEECVEKEFDRREFDVYLIDLDLDRGVRPFFGHMFITIRAFEVPGSVTVVYSRHGQPENIVQAVRNGATDFLVKGEVAPHEVAGKVAKLLDELRRREEEHQKITALARKNERSWKDAYAGRVITIARGEVVNQSRSRLEAVVRYANLRRQNPDWPIEPDLLEIPEADEVSE